MAESGSNRRPVADATIPTATVREIHVDAGERTGARIFGSTVLARCAASIGWNERPLHTRWGVASWAIGLACMGVALLMPNAYLEHLDAVVVLAVAGIAHTVANYLVAARLDSPLHRLSDAIGLAIICIGGWATGGVTSPVWPLLLVFLSYSAWFLDASKLWPRMAAAFAATCSPLAYQQVFGTPDSDVLLVTLYSTLSAVVVTTIVLVYNRNALDVAQRRLVLLAATDPLTGLPNRREFAQVVEAQLATHPDTRIALVMIDLDNFKDVNTHCGHLEGDVLLRQIAGRLRSVTREQDCVARLGGDEFAAMLTGVDSDAAQLLAARFVDEVVLIGNESAPQTGVRIGASAGWAMRPDDGMTIDELLVAADGALGAIKRGGKGRAGTRMPAVEAV